jgi:hypothetical protein
MIISQAKPVRAALNSRITGGTSDRYSLLAVDFHRVFLAGLPVYSP